MLKRLLIFVGIGLLFLLLLFAIVWKVIAPAGTTDVKGSGTVLPVSATDRNPQTFIASCYTAYVRAVLSHDNLIPTQAFLDNNHTCFTEKFLDNWSVTAEESGLDPVVLTEKVEPIGDISDAVLPNGDQAANGQFLVTLGTGASKRTLIVTLVSQSVGFKIDSVDLKRN